MVEFEFLSIYPKNKILYSVIDSAWDVVKHNTCYEK